MAIVFSWSENDRMPEAAFRCWLMAWPVSPDLTSPSKSCALDFASAATLAASFRAVWATVPAESAALCRG
jgi:hypothetical protein